jgi:hypothetical protein
MATEEQRADSSIVGVWRLVSFATADEHGGTRPYWDDQASGLIVYTLDGRLSAQVYDTRRARLGTSWELASPRAAQQAFTRMASYYGTFRLDTTRHLVTHVVEGAMSPDWVGTELVRAYRFLGPDRLELRVVTSADGSTPGEPVLVWDRI